VRQPEQQAVAAALDAPRGDDVLFDVEATPDRLTVVDVLLPSGATAPLLLANGGTHDASRVTGTSISLDLTRFREVAHALLGGAPLDLTQPLEPRDEMLGSYWQALTLHVRHVAGAGRAFDTDLIRRTTFATVVGAVLSVFPVAAATATVQHPDQLPAPLRRAVEFIRSRLAEGATVEEIAESARMSVRGVQAAFQRDLHRTPLGYLRQLRLVEAHDDLVHADPADGTTVEEIAARWGFSSSGRFAAAYRAEYGVLPSVTLRR
jgi:AraC-like DNA-binding protein